MQNWQKTRISILAMIVAFAGWQLVQQIPPLDGGSAPMSVSHDQGRTVVTHASLVSMGAEAHIGPSATLRPSGVVTSALTASMSLTPGATDVGRVVIFHATASGGTGIYSYNWSSGDGERLEQKADTYHAYNAPRTYPVVLWVNDSAAAKAKAWGNVTVNPLPAASASATHAATDVGISVGFGGTVSGGTAPLAYAWSFGDESYSTALRPNHTYGRPGKFTATFTVTDPFAPPASASIVINVNPQLAFTPTASTNRPTVADDVSFNVDLAGGTPPFTYEWDFRDGGKSTSQNTTYRFRTTGVFNVRVTVTDAVGASSTNTVTIAAAPMPEAMLTASSAIAISSLTLIASVVGTALLMTIIQRRRQSRLGRWRPK